MATKKRKMPQLGCLGWTVIVIVTISVIAGLISMGHESAPSDGPSEALLTIQCDRAIAPDKAANYQVVQTDTRVYTVSGQTLAGARYYCHYEWLGGDNLALIESGVSP